MDRDSICEKNDYAAFLKHSIALVTKSVYALIYEMMSCCFGTKEDCEKMAELIDHLTISIDNSDKSYYKGEIVKLANECMCARDDIPVNEDYLFAKSFDKGFYWFTACQMILRKHRYKKWDELEETLNDWEAIACLNIIIHAKVMNTKGEYIFQSFINKHNEEKAEYNFIALSKRIKSIGSSDHLQGVEFDENVRIILTFLSDLKQWYKACYKSQDCQQWRDADNAWIEIKRHYNDFLCEKASHLQDIYVQLNELNDSASFYILITTPPMPENLTEQNLQGLSNVPWCCAINYGPTVMPKFFVNKQLKINLKFHVCGRPAPVYTDFLEFLNSKAIDNINQHEKVYEFLKGYLKCVMDELKPKNKHIHVVMLCYGEYAVNDSVHSLSFFHERLKYLHSFLVKIGNKASETFTVLFYTDRVSPLNGISPCYHIPLVEFCNHLHGENCGVLKYNKPMILPSCNGNLLIEGKPATSKEPIDDSIPFILRHFEIVHKYVDKAELKTFQNTSFDQEQISQQEINQHIIEDLTIRFLRGSGISWVGLSESYRLDIKRRFTEEIKKSIKSLKNTTTFFQVYHEAGAGASTFARRVLYDLREKFVCLVLREDYKHSDKTVLHLKALYDKLKCSILLLVDEDLPQLNIKQIFTEIRSNSISCILFKITRVPSLDGSTSRSSFPYFLTNHLSESEEKSLKEKYHCYLNSALMTEKAVHLFNAQTFQLVEKSVIASKVHFDHCQAKHSEDGVITDQPDEYSVQVQWSNMTERCSINDVQVIKYSKTSQSYMFSGALHFLNDSNDKIYKYISLKLTDSSKSFPDKMKFLAYLCLLFIYYPNRLYLQCYLGEWKDIKNKIPKEAYEFIFVDPQQHFRIVHNVVAKKILEFYINFSGCNYLQLIINFLAENVANLKIIQAFMWERQFVVSQKKVIRQSFSHLIESLSVEDTEDVLLKISKLLKDFISLSNLARYYSIQNRFIEAQNVMEDALKMKEAEKIATRDQELGIGYTQFGDIYRHKLHCQVENIEDCTSYEDGSELCYKAIEMYEKSKDYITLLQNQQYQIYGEVKVRLDYLLFIKNILFDAKKCTSSTQDFLKYLDTDKNAKKMVEACHELFQLLDDSLFHGDNEIPIIDIVKTQNRFYKLIGKKYCQQFLNNIEKVLKNPNSELAIKRRYVLIHLAMNNKDFSDMSKKKGLKLIEYLEFIFDKEGYKTDTVLQWLLLACNFPSKYSNIDNVLLVLNRWSKHIQAMDTLVLLYFYASYFIAALKCRAREKAKFYRYIRNCNKRLAECREEESATGSKHKILWLLKYEKEACKISHIKPKLSCLEDFKGKVITFDGSKLIVLSKFYKIFQYTLHILPSNMPDEVEVDDMVTFSIEFTFKGIKAIDIKLYKKSTGNLQSQAAFFDEQDNTPSGT